MISYSIHRIERLFGLRKGAIRRKLLSLINGFNVIIIIIEILDTKSFNAFMCNWYYAVVLFYKNEGLFLSQAPSI